MSRKTRHQKGPSPSSTNEHAVKPSAPSSPSLRGDQLARAPAASNPSIKEHAARPASSPTPSVKERAARPNAAPPGTLRSYAPATGALIAEIRIATPAETTDVVDRARKAQVAWGAMPVAERAERLLRFRDAIVDRADELIDIISKECGKPRNEALLHEIMMVADSATSTCRRADRVLAPQTIPLHLFRHRKSTVSYVPRGVIGIISPWNYPFAITMCDVFAALVSGSAVVVKPSEITPLILLKTKEIYNATGLPEDLFAVVVGGAATGKALIDSGIQKLIFTGSVAVGRHIAVACGERLTPCVLELGGKAPLIACADADIEQTAKAIVYGGLANSGQICISVERVYAHKDIYEPLIRRTKQLVSELRQGDPALDYVDVGAIIFDRQIEVLENHVADAVKKGAELLTGGQKKSLGPGQFFEPTLIGKCSHAMTVMTEEIFGPIIPFQSVQNDEEAIALANDSHLGLNAYVFTRNRAKGLKIAEQVAAGSVVVNDVLSNYASSETPFGGIKNSGIGRVHGDEALRAMCETKHISVDRFNLPASSNPMSFPYSEKNFRWALRAFRTLFSGKGIIQRIGEFF